MRKMLDTLYAASAWLAGICMVGVLVMVLLTVLSRLFGFSAPGTDAYAGYATAGAGFMALASTLKKGEHIRVTLIMNRLSPGAQRALDIFCHAFALVVCGALAWFSIGVVFQSYSFNDISTGLDATPLWIPQLGMAIGTSIFALAFAVDFVDLLAGRKVADAPRDNEPAHVE